MGSGVWILPLLYFFVAVGVAVIIIIVVIISTRSIKRIDVKENAEIIEIDKSRKKFTKGYTRGKVKSIKSCKNGTTRFEFYPFDNEEGFLKEIPAPIPLVVKDEFWKISPPGDISNQRTIITTIPRLAKDVPESLKGTTTGNNMAKEGQLAFLENQANKWIVQGDEAFQEWVSNNTRLGMTRASLKANEEKVKSIIRTFEGNSGQEKKT